jgi:hypothetical protein
MARSGDIKKFIKRRPPWFWWTLAHLLAGAFAVASWSFCLFLFSLPERTWNYDMLRKLGRITPVEAYDPIEAPEGTSADPQGLLARVYSLGSEQLEAHNLHYKRNYITNFTKPEVVHYIEGSYRLTSTRTLTEEDFFHPGLVSRLEAVVRADELAEPSPYPVIVELLLPFKSPMDAELFSEGHQFDLKFLEHRALILHAARTGTAKDPRICLTVVPLSFENYLDPEGNKLPLAAPDPLRVAATFPLMKENRRE